MFKKHEQWSSASIKSETDSEIGLAPSASPEFTPTNPSLDDVWQKNTAHKSISRSSQVQHRPHTPVKREHALYSFQAVRRSSRDDGLWNKNEVYTGNDRTPAKTEEVLGKPESVPIKPKVPLRSVRKQVKRSHVRSEEVPDSIFNVEKGVSLGTIDETVKSLDSEEGKRSLDYYNFL